MAGIQSRVSNYLKNADDGGQKSDSASSTPRGSGSPATGRWSSSMPACKSCEKSVYPMEQVTVDTVPFHKTCFKCDHCQKVLSLGTYASLDGRVYCKPHFKQLFALKGNYNEGFGTEPHKHKWERTSSQEQLAQRTPSQNQLAPAKSGAAPAADAPPVAGDDDPGREFGALRLSGEGDAIGGRPEIPAPAADAAPRGRHDSPVEPDPGAAASPVTAERAPASAKSPAEFEPAKTEEGAPASPTSAANPVSPAAEQGTPVKDSQSGESDSISASAHAAEDASSPIEKPSPPDHSPVITTTYGDEEHDQIGAADEGEVAPEEIPLPKTPTEEADAD